MKTRVFTIAVMIFSLISTVVLFGQDVYEKKLERKLKKIERDLNDKEYQLHSIEIPEIHIDLSGLEESMIHFEHSLSHLEHIEIPEIPEIHVDIPEINVPEIDLDFSHFDFDFDFAQNFHFDFDHDFSYGEFYCDDWGGSDLFDDLSEDEEIKVSAIRSMGRQDAEKAVPALKKVIAVEFNPAYRYEAVRQLRRFLDEKGVLKVLAETAKNDENVDVRKRAIYVLGKSDSPKAVEILEEIAER